MREPESRKKAYRKPETLSREKLEALALICSPGKTSGAGGDCDFVVNS
jgi:hypothetical protein